MSRMQTGLTDAYSRLTIEKKELKVYFEKVLRWIKFFQNKKGSNRSISEFWFDPKPL